MLRRYTSAALSVLLLVNDVSAFTITSKSSSSLFVAKNGVAFAPVGSSSTQAAQHGSGCSCGCRSWTFALFSTTEEAAPVTPTTPVEIPEEVAALDGINSEEEAHNTERPARKSLKKKGPKGKALSEFKIGDSVKAKVKTITSYGAFMDIGAETDGLLHISNLAVDFVKDVNDVLEIGKEYDVRISKIDEGKKQVALTLLSVAQEEQVQANADARESGKDKQSSNNNRSNNNDGQRRGDDNAVRKALVAKGWDSSAFVSGTVVSTVDFGAFVRIDCSQLGVEGEIDGLVHISALANNRVDKVTSVVNVNDKVNVRIKGIDKNKVSLSMVSVEDEESKNEARGNSGDSPQSQGNKDWKEALEKLQHDMPVFKNNAVVVDNRK